MEESTSEESLLDQDLFQLVILARGKENRNLTPVVILKKIKSI